jgi:hypothetical protein
MEKIVDENLNTLKYGVHISKGSEGKDIWIIRKILQQDHKAEIARDIFITGYTGTAQKTVSIEDLIDEDWFLLDEKDIGELKH